MFETAFQIIPKGVNEIYWTGGVIGVVILLLTFRENEKKVAYFFLLTLFLMLIWRIQYKIIASRYSLSMVYHFIILMAFAFYFLSSKRKGGWKLALIATFIASLYFYGVSIKRNREDIYYYAVASLYDSMNHSRGDYKFYAQEKDFKRIRFMSGVTSCKELTSEKSTFIEDICNKNNTALFTNVVAIVLSPEENAGGGKKVIDPKKIMSFQTGKKKKSVHNVYLITSTVKCRPISLLPRNDISSADNLLKNGNMDEIESKQDSFLNLTKNIKNYEAFYNAESRNRTPVGAYFHSTTPLTGDEVFTVTSGNAIFGNSVKIRSPRGLTYLLFSNRLQNGDFIFSFYVKGEKGTIVRMVYTPNRWNVNTLAEFEIPDKRTYCISCDFPVHDIQPPGYFIVGASVLNGEAYIDNFILTKRNTNKTSNIKE